MCCSALNSTAARTQMFTGPKLKGWSNMITLWPLPVQAHVARAFECPYATVLVLPKQALLEAMQAAEQAHVQRMIDACCRVPTFRHMPLSGIAGMARHCRVRPTPAAAACVARSVLCHVSGARVRLLIASQRPSCPAARGLT